MCGRYASTTSRSTLLDTFEIDPDRADPELAPDYNVAPTKTSPVVIARAPKDTEDAQPPPERQLRNLKWGLTPFWAKDPKIGSRMINARAETVHEKPAYRQCFKSRRAIIPVSGFYEWFPTNQVGKSGKPLKQPYYIHPALDAILPLAGIFDFWRNPEAPDDDPDAWLVTFSVITTNATDDVGHIHDRMPMSVAPENWVDWLDPTNTDVDYARTLMAPPEPGSLDTYPVSKAVNNVRNNSEDLLTPIAAENTN
ncbi:MULTISPECIES: SOS response-associated peptidase [unclassified Rhodococcus (in: high G+C Gram-positive bacteria)]|uniref:SOS response-associated peptidase n=1 Tax=unclassified Rhodococcus (in: high G+C Gram-positive bacteria) TaxID=192944 RepID=UPI00163A58ED|nr:MULTISPECIES: SOS response-associated peptidase [unclassified Rhodococcus (in: high G+C Gram-positive bacteria)]MBC2637833.1 SOS response-associated peptidase [Rhodococcus sp. 3A]MBC2897420.1 SOS response-associated peptidase [Rhodococcus sp. 4CII]